MKAPFAGVVEQRFVQLGDYLDIGHKAVRLLDLSKLKVKGQVAEREVSRLKPGMPAELSFVSGQRLPGEITLSPVPVIAPPAPSWWKSRQITRDWRSQQG